MRGSLKMLCAILVIFTLQHAVQGGCGDHKDCLTCANSAVFFVNCRWCELTSTCHAPGSLVNPCVACDNSDVSKLCSVTEASKCDRTSAGSKSGAFEPYEAYNATLYSAVAYTDDPVRCAKTIFPAGLIEIIDVIGRKCDYLFKYKECFAFTAVSHAMEKIILAYRGTTSKRQLVEEFATVLGKFKVSTKVGGNVQEYFSNANDQLYPCAKLSLQELVMKYPHYRVIVTGHSLGGAVASIASAQLSFDNILNKEKTTLYTFGMPRTGDRTYAESHDKLIPKSWRLVHFRDIVPKLPTMSFLSSSPFHHQREIFYGLEMELTSDYIECFDYEDEKCGKSVLPSTSSENYHRIYYGIIIGSHCDDRMRKRRKRSDEDSDMSHLFTNDTCKRVRVTDLSTGGAERSVQALWKYTTVMLLLFVEC